MSSKSKKSRSRSRTAASSAPTLTPANSSPRFLPPSHYAAAAGISYTPGQTNATPSPLSATYQDRATTPAMPTSYHSEAASFDSAISYEPQSSVGPSRSSSLASKESTACRSDSTSSSRGSARSVKRQNQLENLEAQLLPSLRDTIDRMTNPASSSTAPGSQKQSSGQSRPRNRSAGAPSRSSAMFSAFSDSPTAQAHSSQGSTRKSSASRPSGPVDSLPTTLKPSTPKPSQIPQGLVTPKVAQSIPATPKSILKATPTMLPVPKTPIQGGDGGGILSPNPTRSLRSAKSMIGSLRSPRKALEIHIPSDSSGSERFEVNKKSTSIPRPASTAPIQSRHGPWLNADPTSPTPYRPSPPPSFHTHGHISTHLPRRLVVPPPPPSRPPRPSANLLSFPDSSSASEIEAYDPEGRSHRVLVVANGGAVTSSEEDSESELVVGRVFGQRAEVSKTGSRLPIPKNASNGSGAVERAGSVVDAVGLGFKFDVGLTVLDGEEDCGSVDEDRSFYDDSDVDHEEVLHNPPLSGLSLMTPRARSSFNAEDRPGLVDSICDSDADSGVDLHARLDDSDDDESDFGFVGGSERETNSEGLDTDSDTDSVRRKRKEALVGIVSGLESGVSLGTGVEAQQWVEDGHRSEDEGESYVVGVAVSGSGDFVAAGDGRGVGNGDFSDSEYSEGEDGGYGSTSPRLNSHKQAIDDSGEECSWKRGQDRGIPKPAAQSLPPSPPSGQPAYRQTSLEPRNTTQNARGMSEQPGDTCHRPNRQFLADIIATSQLSSTAHPQPRARPLSTPAVPLSPRSFPSHSTNLPSPLPTKFDRHRRVSLGPSVTANDSLNTDIPAFNGPLKRPIARRSTGGVDSVVRRDNEYPVGFVEPEEVRLTRRPREMAHGESSSARASMSESQSPVSSASSTHPKVAHQREDGHTCLGDCSGAALDKSQQNTLTIDDRDVSSLGFSQEEWRNENSQMFSSGAQTLFQHLRMGSDEVGSPPIEPDEQVWRDMDERRNGKSSHSNSSHKAHLLRHSLRIQPVAVSDDGPLGEPSISRETLPNPPKELRRPRSPMVNTWRATLSSPYQSLVQKYGEQELQRQEVIWELCESEHVFVKHLRSVVRLFIQPLRAQVGIKSEQDWILGVPSDVARLFDWFDDILNLHVQIHSAMRKLRAMDGDPIVQRVAEAFRIFVPRLEVYQPYLARVEAIVDSISSMVQDRRSEFGEYVRMKEGQPDCRGQCLSKLLVEPVVRLAQYPVLFRRLWEATPRQHVDYLPTFSLLHSTEMIIQVMREVKTREEEYEIVKDICSRIANLPSESLARRDRRLLFQGPLLWHSADHQLANEASSLSSNGSLSAPSSSSTSIPPPGRSEEEPASRKSRWKDSIHTHDSKRMRSGSVNSTASSLLSLESHTSSSSSQSTAPVSTPATTGYFDIRTLLSLSRESNAEPGRPQRLISASSTSQSSIGATSCTPIHAFVFTDLIVLAILEKQSQDPSKQEWRLLDDFGLGRILRIEDPADLERRISLEILPMNIDELESGVISETATISPMQVSVPLPWKEDPDPLPVWFSSLQQSHRHTVRSFSFPSHSGTYLAHGPSVDLETDTRATVTSLLAAGLPIPKSPSMQIQASPAEFANLTQDEREERGWWALRFQQILRELQRVDLSFSLSNLPTSVKRDLKP